MKPHETVEFCRTLAVMAEDLRPKINGDFAVVRGVVDDADVVFGVWFDFTKPSGVDTMIVKGAPLLRRIVHLGRSQNASIAAIPCTCIEQADALRLHVAEPEQLH